MCAWVRPSIAEMLVRCHRSHFSGSHIRRRQAATRGYRIHSQRETLDVVARQYQAAAALGQRRHRAPSFLRPPSQRGLARLPYHSLSSHVSSKGINVGRSLAQATKPTSSALPPPTFFTPHPNFLPLRPPSRSNARHHRRRRSTRSAVLPHSPALPSCFTHPLTSLPSSSDEESLPPHSPRKSTFPPHLHPPNPLA